MPKTSSASPNQSLYLALLLTFLFYIVFFFTAIFVFLNDPSKWVGLLAALVHPFMAIPLAFFVFYKGYFGAVMGKGYFTFYKLGETLLICVGGLIRLLRLLLLPLFVPRTPLHGLRNVQSQEK